MNHPECGGKEIFLMNTTKEDFNELTKWEKKRLGDLAYDMHGELLRSYDQAHLFPMFVDKEEYNNS
ncbi:hypothetical protein ACFL2R_03535 [Patescibacteria group bacterium]